MNANKPLYSLIVLLLFLGCLQNQDAKSVPSKSGFRPFYLNDKRVFLDKESDTTKTKEWYVNVEVEDTTISRNGVVLSVLDSIDSVSEKRITLYESYKKEASLIDSWGCDMYAWYPDSGNWGNVKSVKFTYLQREYNIKIEQCMTLNWGGPSQSGGRVVKSYIDSSLGVVVKEGVYSGIRIGECNSNKCQNTLDLVQFNEEKINSDIIRKISDSLFLDSQ